MREEGVFLILLTSFALSHGVRAIHFIGEEDTAPLVLENGSLPALTLDCPYALEEEDYEGLVVYWLYNNIPSPVYQWIPYSKPQAVTSLRDRLDLNFSISSEDYHRHRALRLLQPTTDLSGNFTCRVSTFNDEKERKITILIYSSPANLKIWTEQKSDYQVVVTCTVDGVFPEPKLVISRTSPGERMPLEISRTETTWSEGTYNMTIDAVVDEDTLHGQTEFECHLTLPGTRVTMKRTTIYFPRSRPIMQFAFSHANLLLNKRTTFLLSTMVFTILHI